MDDKGVDYKLVADNLQRENERLRMKVITLENKKFIRDSEFRDIIRWVEDHYLFVIVVALICSYMVGHMIELYGVWRKNNGR